MQFLPPDSLCPPLGATPSCIHKSQRPNEDNNPMVCHTSFHNYSQESLASVHDSSGLPSPIPSSFAICPNGALLYSVVKQRRILMKHGIRCIPSLSYYLFPPIAIVDLLVYYRKMLPQAIWLSEQQYHRLQDKFTFNHLRTGVEEESEFRRFEEPGRPVMANKVSINGENTSGTRKINVGRERGWNRKSLYETKTGKTVIVDWHAWEMRVMIISDKDQGAWEK
jgi:hypothetical protein